jgi:CheY-like chemotaxis protein
MIETSIYKPTAKGRAELAASPGHLGPNLKVLLGMFDGQSTVDQLLKKLKKVSLDQVLAARDKLVSNGYIELTPGTPERDDVDFATLMGRPVREPTVQQIREAEETTISGVRRLKRSGYFINILSRPTGHIAPRSGDTYSVLILDGDRSDVLVMARAMALARFDVRSASCVEDIMTQLDKSPPDVIVMDLILPGLVGLEVLAKTREHSRLRKVPVIVVTAEAAQEDIISALVYGANGYMTKPVKPEALLDAVKTILGVPDPVAAVA